MDYEIRLADTFSRNLSLSKYRMSKIPRLVQEAEDVLNERLEKTGIVSLNHVYDLLGFPRIPEGDVFGWVFSPWEHVSIHCVQSIDEENIFKTLDFVIAELKFNPTPKAIKPVYMKGENNMPPRKNRDVPCILAEGMFGLKTIELKIKRVIFNGPATIVFWSDGSKTVVKCGENDTFDPEKGLAMAISKKFLGNNYKAYGRFKKWLPKEYKKTQKLIEVKDDAASKD